MIVSCDIIHWTGRMYGQFYGTHGLQWPTTRGDLPGILGEFPVRCQHWPWTSSPDPNLDVAASAIGHHQSWKFLKAHAQPALLHAPGNHAPWPMIFQYFFT